MFVFVLRYPLNNVNRVHSLVAATVVITMEKMVFSHKHKIRIRNKLVHQEMSIEFGLAKAAT